MKRRLAREAALQLLFQVDVGQSHLKDAIDWMNDSVALDPEMQEFAIALARGVIARKSEIDDLLAQYSVGWQVDRMAAVDRNLLRLGLYEMFYRDDIPLAVTINELVEVSKRFGDVKSSRFVNGILGNVKRDIEALEPGPQANSPKTDAAHAGPEEREEESGSDRV